MTITFDPLIEAALNATAADTGFSRKDLVQAFVRVGLRQMADSQIVIRADDLDILKAVASSSTPAGK